MRFIGVDLHTTQITVCYLKTMKEFRFEKYDLAKMAEFVAGLQPEDEIAVEVCGNSRRFVRQAEKKVVRVSGRSIRASLR